VCVCGVVCVCVCVCVCVHMSSLYFPLKEGFEFVLIKITLGTKMYRSQ